MSVTIGEMHVDVKEAPAAAKAPAASAEPAKDIDLHHAMEILHTRKLRLRAD